MSSNELILGIDIGTTSVKVCVFNVATRSVEAKHSKDTQSNVPSDQGTDGNKQNVPKIVSAFNTCIAKLPKDLLQKVTKIGVCGQMHGVLLWNNTDGPAWEKVTKDGVLMRYDVIQSRVSALYTWQDWRCDETFMASLPKPDSHLPTYSGYGIATLFWMARNKPEKVKKFNCAGTIQDFVVAMLCNLDTPVMSEQNAASWGYFNCQTHQWNHDILKNAAFPTHLLPTVVNSSTIAGKLSENWHSIPEGSSIGVALGDLQCSVLATIESTQDVVLNISTSAQLAFVIENFELNASATEETNVEYFPYFNNSYLAVAASLNGGNALATFVKMIQQWTLDLGFLVPQSQVWEKLIKLGSDSSSESELNIQPTLLGERRLPNISASVANINLGNLGLGQVFRAMCRGLLDNLHRMMPREILEKANINRIVGNGSGLSRNPVLQNEVQLLYKLPLVFTSGGDAAKGAAMAVNLEFLNQK